MANGIEKRNDWLSRKIAAPIEKPDYENADRALDVFSQWIVGYDVEEIAAFYKITTVEVEIDLQYVRKNLNARQVISQNNDRERIRLQRSSREKYSKLLEAALDKPVDSYLESGVSPVSVLREYREAVSMTEKPGGLSISFTKNTAKFGAGAGGFHPANFGGHQGKPIKSYEDLVRMIIEQDPSCGLQPVIDVDSQEVESHEIPPENPLADENEDDTDDT